MKSIRACVQLSRVALTMALAGVAFTDLSWATDPTFDCIVSVNKQRLITRGNNSSDVDLTCRVVCVWGIEGANDKDTTCREVCLPNHRITRSATKRMT